MSKKLFTGLKIKNKEIKNRIFVPPMITPFAPQDSGYVVEKTVDSYRRMAQGQNGLIIVEATCVNFHGRLGRRQLGLWEDEQIAGHKQIVEAVQQEGSVVFVQIHHAGVVGIADDALCPSEYTHVKADGSEKIGRPMTAEDIKNVQDAFVSASLRAYQAGYDGIELHGCHNYLICQFLNKKVNQRQDQYGLKRTLFVEEIIARIREKVDDDFIIGIRLGGFEPTLEDAATNAVQLEKAGIDFFDISYGFRREQEVEMPENYPFWDIIYAAEYIKTKVNVPVFAANFIMDPDTAEAILTKAKVDMVGVARGVMVNYDWAKEAQAGLDVGRCLRCAVCMLYSDPEKCPGRILHKRNREKALT
ncbi:MAG: NADH:flavin oxidoreductase [Firmicutes bacterium]|nr:NADH:flavin oxidoreductase [Bacillota bacterium]